MSRHHQLAAMLLLLVLAACSQQEQQSRKQEVVSRTTASRVCGESFCLPDGTTITSRASPVEDFNLYEVEHAGERFMIYEGNAPQRRAGSIVLGWAGQWPNFLEVSCAEGTERCSVGEFAAKLTRRALTANDR